MNHDYTHCWDFDAEVCPKECFRAQLVRDLMCFHPNIPVSWGRFKNTKECKLREDSMSKLSATQYGELVEKEKEENVDTDSEQTANR